MTEPIAGPSSHQDALLSSMHSYFQREGAPPKNAFFRKAFDRFTGSKKNRDEVDDYHRLEKSFAGLSKKAAICMNQLLQTTTGTARHPPMLWTDFCKMMGEMGFSIDHGAAGSSLRFDPPDSTTRSISLHKPHPEQHIEPVTLRIWGRKLKEYYGWDEEVFLRHVQTLPGHSPRSRLKAAFFTRSTTRIPDTLSVGDQTPPVVASPVREQALAGNAASTSTGVVLSLSPALAPDADVALAASTIPGFAARITEHFPAAPEPPSQATVDCVEPSGSGNVDDKALPVITAPVAEQETGSPTTRTPATLIEPESAVAPETLSGDESEVARIIEAVPVQAEPGPSNSTAAPGTDAVALVHLSLSSLSGTTAESARSYVLQNSTASQGKVKTRKVASDVCAVAEPAKKGFLARMGGGSKGKGKMVEEQDVEEESLQVPRPFGKLGKKVADSISQVLRTKDAVLHPRRPMRWTTFQKTMAKVGFQVDHSSGSSSVCFTPVGGLLKGGPVHLHKPHGHGTDTIEPITLHHWGKRLKETYPDLTGDLISQLEAEDDSES
ncbi:hypothetical protein PENSPDRAFT_685964 [Peniophora sp. CONT]|nr:hypothetical protein PENSPDRAFT_685964 [Peniophora sp. CONT]